MISKTETKKIERKQKRLQHLITADSGIVCGNEPTENLVVCNAGLSTGLQQEVLLDEFSHHGAVVHIAMLREKSYCFVKCANTSVATAIYDATHGRCRLGQNGGVIYLSYCAGVPNVDSDRWKEPLPAGLIIVPNILTVDEEEEFMQLVWSDDHSENGTNESCGHTLKHRQVKHFGFEFIYGKNNCDSSKPLLDQPIPTQCNVLWSRLERKIPIDKHPDQLTVNKYLPGHGIPVHCDTHSAFLEPIVALSLGSDIVMEWHRPGDTDTKPKHVSVLVPRRSILIMTGESRYGWSHGITPRKIDVVHNESGHLTTMKRNTRVSFTFRWLKSDPCTCNFPLLCDTQQTENGRIATKKENDENELMPPSKLELENVHKVYNEIANHFSETRHSPWPQVETFVKEFDAGSVLVDIGCGNGKYLHLNENIAKIGCDRSEGLLKVCRERGINAFQCDCLAVPIRTGSVDGIISIAVIHHLASKERRLKAISEMVRILRPSGRALIYVWAKNQALKTKSSYLRQNKKNNRDHTEPDTTPTIESKPSMNGLPVHTNRTQFVHQDILVPWKLKKSDDAPSDKSDTGEPAASTFLRYYHVFEENELESLCTEIDGITIRKSYYDQGNWCVIFEKM